MSFRAPWLGGNPPPPAAPPSAAPASPLPALALAVAIAAILACIAGIANGFTQDDISIIHDSTRLHGFAELHDILTLPYWPPPAVPDLYRPVTSLLLAAQYVVGDGAPIVFRLVSYALYACVCVAVFRLVAALVQPMMAALLAGVLFAVHPLHVEATALAVAQNELLVALLTTLAVIRYVARRRAGALRAADWALLVFLYSIAALAKEQGLLMPGFLLLAEAFLVPDIPFRARVAPLWKGFLALVIAGTLVVAARTSVLHGTVAASLVADALRGKTFAGRVVTMLRITPDWLRLLVWPVHLRADYSPQEFVGATGIGARETFGFLILVAGAYAIWVARRRAQVAAFGLAWCALALLPVSNVFLPTGILVAERTLFLPSVGFTLAVGGALAYAVERYGAPSVATRRMIGVLAGVFVVAGLLRSAARQIVWHDPTSLTFASIVDSPRSWRVQLSYAEMMFDLNEQAKGEAAFRQAVAFAPRQWIVRNRFAQRLRVAGNDSAALTELRLSVKENPDQVEALAGIPPTLIALGQYQEAKRVADSIIVAAGAPPLMLWLRHVADSAIAVKAPQGAFESAFAKVRLATARAPVQLDASPHAECSTHPRCQTGRVDGN